MIALKDINERTEKLIIRPAKTKEPVFLIFPNKEEKKKYLWKETQYCAGSHDAYMIAKPKNNKIKLREFLDKRVAFAVLSGFIPYPENYTYWYFNPQKKEEKSLA